MVVSSVALSDSSFSPLDKSLISPSNLRSIILGDPCQTWLKIHGKHYGFEQDKDKYSLLELIFDLGRRFEDKWIRETLGKGIKPVCSDPTKDLNAQMALKTLDLMDRGEKVIYQGLIINPVEGLYGFPDLICKKSWLAKKFSGIKPPEKGKDHYVILDIKYTRSLGNGNHDSEAMEFVKAQIRIYSYILGHLQGYMPEEGYIICRGNVFEPIPVAIKSTLGQPIDQDIRDWCDAFIRIRDHGTEFTPFNDESLLPNFRVKMDEPWRRKK